MLVRRTIATVLFMAMWIPASYAGDPPPDTVFRKGDVKQKGKQSTYCWDGTCADYIPTPPKKFVKVPVKKVAHIRIKFAAKPSDVTIECWRELDEHGRPTGESKTISHALVPHKIGGQTKGWDAVFDLPGKPGHVYVRLLGFWEEPSGDSSWFFHWKLIDN